MRTTLSRNQAGFEAATVLAVVAILAVIGFAGFKVWQRGNDKSVASTSSTSQSASVPETIDSKADLTSASAALDDSASDVNSGVNGDSLDGDINDLL